MDEGSYNNIIRTNSPFSPATPNSAGAPAYKANVNRTKTRKWVEAKVQNYDGDDWGDDSYDEDETEESPPPAKPTGLRQPGQSGQLSTTHSSAFMPPARTFSQPVQANAPQAVMGPRAPTLPITSHVPQNRPSPPVAATGQVQTRFPPRKSSMRSMKQQEGVDTADAMASRPSSRPGSSSSNRPQLDQKADPSVHAAGTSDTPGKAAQFVRPADIYRRMGEEMEKQRQSLESGRPSMDSIHSRGDNASPANAPRSSTERRRTSFDRDDGTPRSPRSTLASVAERKSEYGLDRLLANAPAEPDKRGFAQNQAEPNKPQNEDLRRLSTSPKLPDLSRVSGFGEDFFSNSLRYSTGPASPLQAVTETQSSGKGSTQKDDLRLSGEPVEQQRSSVLEGPKLEPNPDVRLPPSGENIQSGVSGATGTTNEEPTPLRPHLPGGWVSETTSLGPERTTSDSINNIGPADLEPTTKVKHLPSTHDNTGVTPEDKVAQVPHPNDFGSVAGHHDDVVASKAISAGPGHHPTPQSLPPLKTGDPLGSTNKSKIKGLKSPPESTTTDPTPSVYTSRGLLDNRSNPTATASTFTPTAPLNPYRLSTSRVDSATESTERKSTTSTIGDPSPLKESDKLREEIMKTLSPSALDPSSSNEGLTNSTSQEHNEVPRESRYLSGVYDDYLSLVEDKTLLETGRALKNESMLATRQNMESRSIADDTTKLHASIPEVAPLSPKRTPDPEQDPVKRQRRFSWEQLPEWETGGPTEIKPTSEAPKETDSQQNSGSPTGHGPNQPGGIISEATGLSPQEPPKPSDHPSEPTRSATPDQPSPVSASTNENPTVDVRRSLAEEKVLIETSPHPIFEQLEHPALSELSDPSNALPPTSVEGSANPTTQPTKIMAFREILNLASPDQRTQKFDETRNQFFGMDSGLSNWLMHMKNQLEQTDGTQDSDTQQINAAAQAQSGPVGMQQPTQQPYYQQYLNASTPNTVMGPPRRTSTGNALGPSGPNTSGFNSGNQVGTKGKELLHAAGAFGNKGVKSGMKLFNKGKNKLRERTNNEKGKSLVPAKTDAAPDSRTRNEHHSSWGISAFRERSASAARLDKGTETKSTARSRGGYHQKARSLSSLTSLLLFRTRHDGNHEVPVSHEPSVTAGTIPTPRDVPVASSPPPPPRAAPPRAAPAPPAGYQQHSQIRLVTNDDDDDDDETNKGSATSGIATCCCYSSYSAPQSSPPQPHQSQLPPSLPLNLVCAHHDPCSGPSYERSGSVSTAVVSVPAGPAHFPTQSPENSSPLALAQAAQAVQAVQAVTAPTAPTFTSHQKYWTDKSATATASAPAPTPSSHINQLHPSTRILPIPNNNSNLVSPFPSPLPSLFPIVRSHSPNHNTAHSSPSSDVPSIGRHHFPQPDLVSPISETRSLTPVPSISNRDERPQLSILDSRVDAPIDSYPLEEDYFGLKPRGVIDISGLPASATTALDVAHNALQLTIHENSAWIEDDYPQSIFYPTDITPNNEPQSQSKMTTAMATNAVNAPAPGDAAPAQSGSPTRQSSFVGLPPIRRTSTFNFLTRKGSGEEDDTDPSLIDPLDNDIPPVPAVPTGLGLQSPDGQLPGRGQKDHIAFHASPPRSQNSTRPAPQQPVNGEPPSQNQNGYGSSSHQVPDLLMPGRGATQPAVAQSLGIAPKAQQVLMGRDLSSGQHQPSFGQASAQPSSSFPSNQGHGFLSQPGGNPIHRFPPGQWKLEESHLSEPLISPNRNRSGTSPPLHQPGYFAYDKETGGPSAGPSQPIQRQTKQSIPPISAQRFPNLFAGSHRSSPQGPSQDQDQAYKVQPHGNILSRSQTDDVADHGRHGSASDLFKEIGSKFGRSRGSSVSDLRPTPNRGDGVSEISVASGDSKDEDLAPPDKKRAFFSAEGSQPKQRSSLNIVRTAPPLEPPPPGQNHADNPDSLAKKRLSDLKGLFKGHPSAKDDQPAKVITTQPPPNSSAQGPVEARNAAFPGPHPQQRPSGPMAPGPAGSLDNRPALVAAQSKFSIDSRNSNEEREKSSGRRIFSNLFGNKSKTSESKPQPSQPASSQGQHPGQIPGPVHPGQLVQPGQIQPPNQQFAIRQMAPGQSPLQQMTSGPQSPPRPMTSDASTPGQRMPAPAGNFTHGKQPSQASIPPYGQLGVPSRQQQQFAQPQRPDMPPQQVSQSSQRFTPSFDNQHPLHSNPVTPANQPGDGLAAAGAALKDSSKPSQEPLNAGESPGPHRGTPTRKPVGSAPARQERGSITSTQSVSTVTQPNSAVSNPEGSVSEHERTSTATQREEGPATQSPAQKATEFNAPGHMRQPSLPSPAQSPPPQTQTPESSSQSQFTSSPKPSTSAQQSSQGINAQANQQRRSETSQEQPAQGRQENQEKGGQTGPPGLGTDLQNPQMTGALPVSNEKTVQSRPSKFLRSMSPKPQKTPTNAEHPEEPLSPVTKMLGPKTKTVIQALSTHNTKEKSSTSKKIFNAFKRNKQQMAAQQSQQQIAPQMPHPGMPGPPIPGQVQAMPPGQGRGVIIPSPHIQAQMQAQLQAQMHAHMQAHMQSGRGPMTPQMQAQIQGQIQARIFAQVQAQLHAQMQAGRGQMPMAGRGQAPPQGPGAPGQPLPPQQYLGQPQFQPQPQAQQQVPVQNPGEQQYAQVPIPRGYEAVHGYNNPGRLDVSPYDVGRHSASPSPTPPLQQFQQAYPPPPQGGSPSQQWDPRMVPQNPQAPMPLHPALRPYGQQNTPNQGLPQQQQQQQPLNAMHLRNISSSQPQPGVLQPQPSPGAAPPQVQDTQPGQPVPASIVIQAPTPAQQFAIPNNGSPHARQPSSGGAQNTHQQVPQQPQQQHVTVTNNDAQGGNSSGHPISPENFPRSDSALSFAPMNSVGGEQLNTSAPAPASGDPKLVQQQQNPPLSDLGRMSSQAATTRSGHDSAASASGATEHIQHEHVRNSSLTPDTNNVPHDRALVVSPEPPEHQQHHPLVQQVSSQSIHVDVDAERASQQLPPPAALVAVAVAADNTSSDNIATEPRSKSLAPSPPEQQPGFYDPSINAKRAAATTDDDFPDDSTKLQPTPPPVQQPLVHQAEPEEKILVDQPVELAAVNDDDDGIPMMSATSYPGQEWNPYGAGEFGDWE